LSAPADELVHAAIMGYDDETETYSVLIGGRCVHFVAEEEIVCGSTG